MKPARSYQRSSTNSRIPSSEPCFATSRAKICACRDDSFSQLRRGQAPPHLFQIQKQHIKKTFPRREKRHKNLGSSSCRAETTCTCLFDVQIKAAAHSCSLLRIQVGCRLCVHTRVCLPRFGALFSDKTFILHAELLGRRTTPTPTPTRRKVSSFFDAGPHRSPLLL